MKSRYCVYRYSALGICVAAVAALALTGCAHSTGRMGNDLLVDRALDVTPRAESYSRFLAAVMLEHNGDFNQAIDNLERAAALAPESTTLNLRLIRIFVRIQDYADARKIAERTLEQNPDNANLWIVYGEILQQLKQTDKAVEAFQKAIELDPENVMGYGALVAVEESTNDFVAAVDIYQRLAKLRPDVGPIHYQLGLSLARINDAAGARKEFERALELMPKLARAHFMLGVICLEAGENEAAALHLAAYVKTTPDDARAKESLAGALGRLKRYDDAIVLLKHLASSKEPEPRYNIEAMYMMIRAGRCADVDEMAPADGAPIFGSLMRALARKGMNEPDKPILDTLDAIPGDIDAECTAYLNELLYLFGRDETAGYFIEAFESARAEGVESKSLDIALARTLMRVDKNEAAEKVLAASLARWGSDVSLHYCLAVVYDNLDRVSETEAQLEAYLKLKPDDPEVLNFLGYFYAEHNMKLDRAEELLKRALDIDPENGFYLDSLGWVYYKRGDADRAIELIRKAILASDNDDVELRSHLGDAYLLKGDIEKAVAEWKRAQRLNPKFEGLQEKLDKYAK